MIRPLLQAGDEFATRNPMALGSVINFVQRAKSVDNASEFTHAGMIVGGDGNTLEALWTVKNQNLWEAYRGERVLIVRNINMTPEVYAAGYGKIERHIGQWYPVHRLLLHLLHLAKWVHWDRLVCSELVAKFETGCAECLGLDKASGFMRNYYGVNPDDLADRWRESRYYQVVFEGVLE
ncbi:MAG: hypothetical protein RBT20_01765 [Syntrophales bacterium]|jgi:hypothetical protein|nr:hypothetical protein [Syntrophales bacterium]